MSIFNVQNVSGNQQVESQTWPWASLLAGFLEVWSWTHGEVTWFKDS